MKISQQVENILRALPATRSSDKELEIVYMQKFGMNLSPDQIKKFRDMPSMETIRRSRQALQMQGKYPATPEVEKARYNKFIEMKQSAGFESPEEVLEKKGYKIAPWGKG